MGHMNETNEEIAKFSAEDLEFDVKIDRETVWLNITQLSKFYERDRTVLQKHIRSIYKENELSKEATCAKNAHVQIEGKRKVSRTVEYYNLDLIISLGFRVNSKKGIQFRQWATKVLKDHILKGYSVNSQKLAHLDDKINQLIKSQATKNLEIKETLKYLLNIVDPTINYLEKPRKK